MISGGSNTSSRMGTWNQELRKLRQLAGLKQEELAEEIGIDQTTVSSVEVGRREPGTDVLLRWVKRCGGRVEIVMPGERALADIPSDLLPEVLAIVRGYLRADVRTRKALLMLLEPPQ